MRTFRRAPLSARLPYRRHLPQLQLIQLRQLPLLQAQALKAVSYASGVSIQCAAIQSHVQAACRELAAGRGTARTSRRTLPAARLLPPLPHQLPQAGALRCVKSASGVSTQCAAIQNHVRATYPEPVAGRGIVKICRLALLAVKGPHRHRPRLKLQPKPQLLLRHQPSPHLTWRLLPRPLLTLTLQRALQLLLRQLPRSPYHHLLPALSLLAPITPVQ